MGYDLTVYDSVAMSFASISTLCSLLTLYLLHDIARTRKWTGFAGLVYVLTVSQLVYDLGFYVRPSTSVVGNFTYFLLQITGGLATTLTTNVISWIVVRIALTMHSYNIKKNFVLIVSIVLLLSLVPSFLIAAGIWGFLGASSHGIYTFFLYYYYAGVRVASILFNFACYVLLAVKLRRMGWTFSGAPRPSGGLPAHPVCVLASRMIFYPVVQVLTRLPAAWLEFGYEMPEEAMDDDAAYQQQLQTRAYQTAMTLYSISSPCAGVGFLFIFLLMQPAAFRHLKARFLSCTDPHKQGHGDPFVSEGGTVYLPVPKLPPPEGLSNPLLSPSPRHLNPYREVMPSVNEEALRNTSSERSSLDGGADGSPGRQGGRGLGLGGGEDEEGEVANSSFASRSSHYLESYNYTELDDDQLLALVDRFDSEEYNRTASMAGTSVQGLSVLAGIVESLVGGHAGGSGVGGGFPRSKSQQGQQGQGQGQGQGQVQGQGAGGSERSWWSVRSHSTPGPST
jgi:hypothetical protein